MRSYCSPYPQTLMAYQVIITVSFSILEMPRCSEHAQRASNAPVLESAGYFLWSNWTVPSSHRQTPDSLTSCSEDNEDPWFLLLRRIDAARPKHPLFPPNAHMSRLIMGDSMKQNAKGAVIGPVPGHLVDEHQ